MRWTSRTGPVSVVLETPSIIAPALYRRPCTTLAVMLWFLLAVGSALFQVLRNMVMKRLGHALDETINVWGRFTFILPFAALSVWLDGVPELKPGLLLYALLFAVTQITGTQFLAL